MKRYVDFITAFVSVLFLSVPVLVSLGWTQNALAAGSPNLAEKLNSAQLSSLCNTINLNGTWVPKYEVDSERNAAKAMGTQVTYSNADRLDISQYKCVLNVRDVKNNELWTFDMAGRVSSGVPTTLPSRVAPDDKIGQSIFRSIRIQTQPDVQTSIINGKPVSSLSGLRIHLTARIPKVPDFPMSFATDVEYNFEFYFSEYYLQGQNQLSSNPPVQEIDIDQVRSTSHITGSGLRIVDIHDPYLPGPLEKTFVAGANYILSGAMSAILNIQTLPDEVISAFNGPDSKSANLVKVSNKLL